MGDSGVRGGRVRYNNISSIYDLLESKAELVDSKEVIEFGYPAESGEQVLVYKGHSTKDAQALGMIDSAVSHGMATLKAMNAITLLKRGSGTHLSVYILHYKPTIAHFEEFMGRAYALERKVAPTTYDQLINDIVRLRERLSDAERRLSALEEKNGGNNIRRGEALPQV